MYDNSIFGGYTNFTCVYGYDIRNIKIFNLMREFLLVAAAVVIVVAVAVLFVAVGDVLFVVVVLVVVSVAFVGFVAVE